MIIMAVDLHIRAKDLICDSIARRSFYFPMLVLFRNATIDSTRLRLDQQWLKIHQPKLAKV